MAANIKQVIENIKKLSADEKALIAHCLISSLETRQDENIEEAWADLDEKRYAELVSGSVKPVSWEEIKKAIRYRALPARHAMLYEYQGFYW